MLSLSVSAAQFLSRVIPFVFNIWFVRQLGADDGAVSVWISPLLFFFIRLLQCNGVRISVASGSERLHCGIHWSYFYSMMVEFGASGFNYVVVLMWTLEFCARLLCLGIILFSDIYSLAFGDDLVQR